MSLIMRSSEGNTRKIEKNMNWMQIDEILWQLISKWNGKNYESFVESISKKFDWSISNTEKYCDMHFKMRKKLNK